MIIPANKGLETRNINYNTLEDVPVLCTLGFMGNVGGYKDSAALPLDGSPFRFPHGRKPPPTPPRGSVEMRLLKLHNIKTLRLFDSETLLTRPEVVI